METKTIEQQFNEELEAKYNGDKKDFAHDTTNPIFQQILAKGDIIVRSCLAQNHNLLPEAQQVLSKDKSVYVRAHLVENPNLLPELQQVFAKNEKSGVRAGLAKNPNLLPELQQTLVKDESEDVRRWLARNLNVLPEVQRRLAQDESKDVRAYLAGNPNLILEVQRRLAQDESEEVRTNLAYNSNLTSEAKQIPKPLSIEKEIETHLNQGDAKYPDGKNKIWNKGPYRVWSAYMNDDHLSEVTIENGNGNTYTFSGDQIDSKNNLIIKTGNNAIKYNLLTGRVLYEKQKQENVIVPAAPKKGKGIT